MEKKITIIGYDLGDAESITDIAVVDDASVGQRIRIMFKGITMPNSSSPGQAIPTAYGYNKNNGMLVFASSILVDPDAVRDIHSNFMRRPSDLLGPVSQERLKAIEERLSFHIMREKGAPSQMEYPELFTDGMQEFQEAVVTFTNAIFEDPKYKTVVVGLSVNSCKVVFCVGHPNGWQPVDVAIYRLILSASVLGKKTYAGMPSEMILAAESCAAFLYVKDQGNSFSVDEGKSVLLIDVGASAIDVSALTMDSCNVEFNSGNNYMGARSIDFLIRDWYIEQLKKDPADWADFQKILVLNETLDQALTLCCRMAKEKVFSCCVHKARIDFLPNFLSPLLTMDQVGKLASEMPIGPVLKQYIGIPVAVADSMGRKTWTDLFQEFIQECRTKMEAENIHISRIILTGSASLMPFVQESVQGVYSELGDDGILKDLNPSRSISMGLALVGSSAIMAVRFREDVNNLLMETEVSKRIGDNFSDLADKLSGVIQDIVAEGIIKKHVRKWRNGEYVTLNDMTTAIERDCRQDRLAPLLANSKECNQVIRDWMTDKVGVDIAQRMMKICERFGVKGFTVDSLNVMKAPNVHFTNLDFGPPDNRTMENIAGVVSVIAGIITFDFAMWLLGMLAAIPGAGFALIIAITGGRNDVAKRQVANKVLGYDLPQFARNLLTDAKVDEQIKKPGKDGKTLAQMIKEAILKDNSRTTIDLENNNRRNFSMAEKITFIGYDLGDGESITDIAVLSDALIEQRIKIEFKDMTMPDNNTPGQAIPTAYGYDKKEGTLVFASSILVDPDAVRDIHINFKRRPGDLLGPVSQERLKAIEERLSVRVMKEKGAPNQVECPELFTDGMRKFQEAVVTFTNAVFEDPEYKAAVVGESVNSSKVVFCVGHPTKWQPLDVAIYRFTLSASVLGEKTYAGMPSEMVLAAESRAAFLYVKNQGNSFSVEEGKSVLLIDVGSSTIDVSALTVDSRNVEFNSGNNYMGARSIDFLIRDWYIELLKKDPADWAAFQEMLDLNETLDQALTLCCRMAKEKVFSVKARKSRIEFIPGFPQPLLTVDQVGKLASEMPIGPVLKQYIGIPADMASSMGRKTWTDLFREFIQECRVKMEAEDIHISRIILTGSASKMPFVREAVRGSYPELGDDGILKDMNPSRSISMGLALVGPSALVAERFREAVNHLMKTEVPKCIGDDLPDLADKLSTIIQDIVVENIVKKHVRKWRNNGYKTLNDMTAAIERDCQQDRLAPLLENSKKYNQAIRNWMTDKVGADIAQRLMEICKRFGVKGLTLDSLNVMKVPDIHLDGMDFGPLDGIVETIAVVVGVIAGVITYAILPVIIGVIIGIIMLISFDFAILLLGLIAAIPVAGQVLLIAIAGAAVAKLIIDGKEEAKRKVASKVQGYNLPQFARNLLTDAKVDEQMKKPGKDGKTATQKIKAAILEDKSRTAIVEAVKKNINEQVAKRADRIMYVL